MLTTAERLFSNDWDAIGKVIREGRRFLITTHVNADPDALGSEVALAELLELMQKETVICNPTPVAANYAFLDRERRIRVAGSIPVDDFDAIFILDISRWERLGPLAEPIREYTKPKVCIDHHPYMGGYADYHLVNTGACASAEIVYDLALFLGVPLSPSIAECLYASIVADTGSFSFSNTSIRSHRIAADLLNKGVQARRIHEQLFQNYTPERLRFLGIALSGLKFDCGGRLAWMSVNHRTLQEHRLSFEDADGFVDLPRNCRKVLLSILFLEVEPGDVKISLRAKGDFNANQLAATFGGGGHNHASGIRMQGTMEAVERLILSEARRAMQPFLES